MCNRAKCSFCGAAKLGLFMGWSIGTVQPIQTTGHVCYGCEDRICNLMAAGLSEIRWLDSISGCD